MKIKGIGFDIDGTLYSNVFMYICTIPSFVKHPRLVWHYSRARVKIREVRPVHNFRGLQADLVAESMGIEHAKARVLIEKKLYEDWENKFRIIRPLAGLKTGVKQLKEEGYKLGVLSDFPVQNKLRFLGLDGCWDCSFTSECTGYLKPHPEPFLELAERLKLKPEEILYVGNSYSKDVEGAAAVGMKTAHYAAHYSAHNAAYSGAKPVKNSIADFTFSRYKQLFDYIHTLNGQIEKH